MTLRDRLNVAALSKRLLSYGVVVLNKTGTVAGVSIIILADYMCLLPKWPLLPGGTESTLPSREMGIGDQGQAIPKARSRQCCQCSGACSSQMERADGEEMQGSSS